MKLFFLLGTLFLFGCGYKAALPLPEGMEKIALPTFSNETFKYGLEEILTREVKERFLLDGRLRVVEKGEDLLVKGKIVEYLRQPMAEALVAVEEYRLRMDVELSLILREENKILRRKRIWEATTYSPTSGPLFTEEEAVRELTRKLALDILNFVVEGWER